MFQRQLDVEGELIGPAGERLGIATPIERVWTTHGDQVSRRKVPSGRLGQYMLDSRTFNRETKAKLQLVPIPGVQAHKMGGVVDGPYTAITVEVRFDELAVQASPVVRVWKQPLVLRSLLDNPPAAHWTPSG